MRKKITIFFKSGNQLKLRAKEFTIRKDGSQITEVSWEGAKPRLMRLNIDEIEAVVCK
ncbi:hypothetical protein [Leucobacter sp. M11]|uniref:hypothetical protein n=1 Tax=Leucobacter sp. M11 TaxID=2993565 RepID=UPI002D80F7E0|nr:hypothetical protein [Leucobacter sp. M11]MEB4614035.1 hypothetical protein [Leucobacter sp. M11]